MERRAFKFLKQNQVIKKAKKKTIKFKVLLDTNSIFHQHGRQQTNITKMDKIREKFHKKKLEYNGIRV